MVVAVSPEIKAFVQRAPKFENHVHLDGAYDLELVYKYLKQFQDQLPEEALNCFQLI